MLSEESSGSLLEVTKILKERRKMARYRRKKKSYSSGGRGGGNSMLGFLMIVFGCVAMIVALIIFGIAVDQLDTAITDASALTWASSMTGLTSVMPLWGMVLFLLFMGAGLASLAGGSYVSIKARYGGGWMDMMMLLIMGGVAVVIALIANGLVITQLDTAMTTVNSTTNTLTGALDIMGIFGMIIFLAMIGAGSSMIVAAGISGFTRVKSMF